LSEREKTNVDATTDFPSLCAALARIVEAKRTGDADALNGALADLGRSAETLFRARVARTLGEFSDGGGYLTLVEDASDALNELLWVVYQKAETFRGTTDAEAASWLRTILDRRLLDKRRTFVRRAAKWRVALRAIPKRLRGLLETETRNDD
jgi:DNA-directed RNA polymerase specialized sigma24 family protein